MTSVYKDESGDARLNEKTSVGVCWRKKKEKHVYLRNTVENYLIVTKSRGMMERGTITLRIAPSADVQTGGGRRVVSIFYRK